MVKKSSKPGKRVRKFSWRRLPPELKSLMNVSVKTRIPVAKDIKDLRALLDKTVPSRRQDENLLIATWNIQKFSKRNKSDQAIIYIAEILKRFDIVALQEVQDSVKGLAALQEHMGSYYKFIFSDKTGNNERLCFMYDKRRLVFTGLPAEIVLQKVRRALAPPVQFHRTPYCVSFRSGKFDFILTTVHILYGKTITIRAEEIEKLAKFIQKRVQDKDIYDPDLIALGDFNIPTLGSKTFTALKSGGLIVPPEIQELHTNFTQNKHYDQIAFYERTGFNFSGKAGVVPFGDVLYKDSELSASKEISDHLPLWGEFITNREDAVLDQILNLEG